MFRTQGEAAFAWTPSSSTLGSRSSHRYFSGSYFLRTCFNLFFFLISHVVTKKGAVSKDWMLFWCCCRALPWRLHPCSSRSLCGRSVAAVPAAAPSRSVPVGGSSRADLRPPWPTRVPVHTRGRCSCCWAVLGTAAPPRFSVFAGPFPWAGARDAVSAGVTLPATSWAGGWLEEAPCHTRRWWGARQLGESLSGTNCLGPERLIMGK